MKFREIGSLFRRLLLGVPGNRRGCPNFANTLAALGFLVSRKLGRTSPANLILGTNNRRHSWRITEREDLTVLDEVFLEQEYAIDVSDPDTVFDLGANFGAASIYFAMRWPQARIVAVEPNPAMFKRLVGNTANYPNISCHACAIGAEDGSALFQVSSSHVASSLIHRDTKGQKIKVPVRSLESLMAELKLEHIDVLKFDVEGAEDLLFQDPEILQRVRFLIGEVHPDLMATETSVFLSRFADFRTQTASLAHGRFLLTGQASRP